MQTIVAHYDEIALKGKNRPEYERKLASNIRRMFEKEGAEAKVRIEQMRIIVETDAPQWRNIVGRVFGIRHYASAIRVASDLHSIKEEAEKIFATLAGKRIALSTKRSWKGFPLKSTELNKELGDIATGMGVAFDYGDPELTLVTQITSRATYLSTERLEGHGGLPVGSTGKVLCLLSGGIDSPAAAWLLMRRGCAVDFLHVHALASAQEAIASPLGEILDALQRYQHESKLLLVPYHDYALASPANRYDLVLFRNFLFRLAERIAQERGYLGIATGDNLAQVASQTLENLRAAEAHTTIPIFRPLIGYNKEEIVDLARRIGTFDASIKEYKDCCSIIARSPATRTTMHQMERQLKRIGIADLIDRAIESLHEVRL